MMFFNYKNIDIHGALFAIATEDFTNQGFGHYTFGHCRDGKQYLDLLKFRIRNISKIEDRKIYVNSIETLSSDYKKKVNDHLNLEIRVKLLEKQVQDGG